MNWLICKSSPSIGLACSPLFTKGSWAVSLQFMLSSSSLSLPWSVSAWMHAYYHDDAVLQCRPRLLMNCRRTTQPSKKVTSSSLSATSPASRDRMSRGTVGRLSPTRWRTAKVRCVRFGVRGKVLHSRQLTVGISTRRVVCSTSSYKRPGMYFWRL